jgi:hypothetical protein
MGWKLYTCSDPYRQDIENLSFYQSSLPYRGTAGRSVESILACVTIDYVDIVVNVLDGSSR